MSLRALVLCARSAQPDGGAKTSGSASAVESFPRGAHPALARVSLSARRGGSLIEVEDETIANSHWAAAVYRVVAPFDAGAALSAARRVRVAAAWMDGGAPGDDPTRADDWFRLSDVLAIVERENNDGSHERMACGELLHDDLTTARCRCALRTCRASCRMRATSSAACRLNAETHKMSAEILKEFLVAVGWKSDEEGARKVGEQIRTMTLGAVALGASLESLAATAFAATARISKTYSDIYLSIEEGRRQRGEH